MAKKKPIEDIPTIDETMTPTVDVVADPEPQPELSMEMNVEPEEPKAIVRPKIIGGICEHCGVPVNGEWVFDKYLRSWRAAKVTDSPDKIVKCKHYHKVNLMCSYCRSGVTLETDLAKKRTVHVYSLPEKPNVLITCCDDYNCIVAHEKRFKIRR